MADSFVPLAPPGKGPRDLVFSAFGPAPHEAAKAAEKEACAEPTVTLQRTGEFVTGIRVQCGCGKVIELSCVY